MANRSKPARSTDFRKPSSVAWTQSCWGHSLRSVWIGGLVTLAVVSVVTPLESQGSDWLEPVDAETLVS